jgi:hypothetical protein
MSQDRMASRVYADRCERGFRPFAGGLVEGSGFPLADGRCMDSGEVDRLTKALHYLLRHDNATCLFMVQRKGSRSGHS